MMVMKGVKNSSIMSGKMTRRVGDNRKIALVNFTCLKREDCLLQFALSTAFWGIVVSNECKSIKPLCVSITA